MSDPVFTIPTPGDGTSGVASSDKAAQQAKFYGEDIWYDISKPNAAKQTPDYVVNSAGDWTLATGLEALRQSLLRRLLTNPGEWKTKPKYGVGARQYVKAKNTAANRAELEARIRSQFLQDPRVDSIASVTITALFDGGLQISVFVIAAGKLRNDLPLPVQLEIH